ncbi:MAG: CoA-binding protein [Vulcanimicrobiota bacterium]
MVSELLKELSGPAPGKAGGLAAMVAGAAGAALYVKCRYSTAAEPMARLEEMALSDGGAFEGYIRAKRAGEDVVPWLKQATESPLSGAETTLGLLEQLPEALQACPRSMTADLLAGAHLLEASTRATVELVKTNLRFFPSPWKVGQDRLAAIQSRLQERDLYRAVFQEAKTVAVIGISEKTEKPAYYVPAYLKQKGHQIWGVHPSGKNSLAERSATQLREFDAAPDMVVFFRRSELLMEHLDDVLGARPRTVWLQQGIVNDEFAKALEDRGIRVVSDRCSMVEHQKLARF